VALYRRFIFYNEKVSDTVKCITKRETDANVKIKKTSKLYNYINKYPCGHLDLCSL